MNDKTKGPQTFPVTLLKPHRHAGIDCAAGAVIQVTAPERAWLAKHKIVDAPAAQKEGAK